MSGLNTQWLAAAALGIMLALCCGCEPGERSDSSAVTPGGAELWAHNCRRCHNLRPPNSLSADQWEVVVNHMRVRAGLSASDARKIAEFLKTAAN